MKRRASLTSPILLQKSRWRGRQQQPMRERICKMIDFRTTRHIIKAIICTLNKKIIVATVATYNFQSAKNMRSFYFIAFLFSSSLFGQNSRLNIKLQFLPEISEYLGKADLNITIKGRTINFDTTITKTNALSVPVSYPDTISIRIGTYIATEDSSVWKSFRAYSGAILQNQSVNFLIISFPKDCDLNKQFFYKACLKCKKKDKVIPIIYGLLVPFHNLGEMGQDFWGGGCMVTDCDPTWHCKRDNLDF